MEESEEDTPLCLICSLQIVNKKDAVLVKQKGADGINNASKLKGSTLIIEAGTSVHKSCRRDYTKYPTVTASSSFAPDRNFENNLKKTRSSTGGFNFKSDCFLCGQTVTTKEKLLKKFSYVLCKNKEVDISIKKAIVERDSDSWAMVVKDVWNL